MKPQRFEIGQAVTPKIGMWCSHFGDSQEFLRPGEIYRVVGHEPGRRPGLYNEWYVFVVGKTPSYHEEALDPVELTTEQVTALLEEPITVSV